MHFNASSLFGAILANFCILFGAILEIFCIIFSANLASQLTKKYDGTALSDGAIWDEFSEQYQHRSIKKDN